MSINAYVGLPGAGKSYAVVANVILPALRQGRRVVTNVPLKRDEVRKITPKGEIVDFPMEAVATNPESIDDYCTAGSVVVLDEVWRLWPAGQKSHQVPVPFRSLLAEHRHKKDAKGNTMVVVLVTQDVSQISAWARVLIDKTFVHAKLDVLGADKKYKVSSYRGAPPTVGAPANGLIREMYGTYRKEIYACYTSHTMAETATGDLNEKPIDQRANFWRRPSVWMGCAFLVVAPIWAFSALSELVAPAKAPASHASEASTRSQAVAIPARSVPELAPVGLAAPGIEPPARARRVPDYRVAGVVRDPVDPKKGFAAIKQGSRFVSIPLSECWSPGDGMIRCAFDGFTVTELGAE